jgi:hypothetical protein
MGHLSGLFVAIFLLTPPQKGYTLLSLMQKEMESSTILLGSASSLLISVLKKNRIRNLVAHRADNSIKHKDSLYR